MAPLLEGGTLLLALVLVAVLLAGLLLLALQRTLGLLLTGVATLALSAVFGGWYVFADLDLAPDPDRDLATAIMLGAGLLVAWTAVVAWSGPIVRFLVRSRA